MNNSQGLVRDAILGAVHKNQPESRPMPHIPHFGFNDNNDLVESFSQGVARMAGEVIAETGSDLDSFVRNRFPTAKVICSAVPECKGTIRPAELGHWSEASRIDVSIVRSPMGVAETGSILLSDLELQVNTIAFLSHDLVVSTRSNSNCAEYSRRLSASLLQSATIQPVDDGTIWLG
jgi:L-lactate dehydrogenase complex protein LldG